MLFDPKSSRIISSRLFLSCKPYLYLVGCTSNAGIQVPPPRPRALVSRPLFLKVKLAPASSNLAHFAIPTARTSAKYHNLSGLLSQSTWGLLYDWRQSRFFALQRSRDVYQRNPGHGQTFDLRLVARYRDGPIIMVGLCLCRRVKSPHRRAVRPPLE